MRFTRRQFVRGGVSAFTMGFAAPQFLSELALAQGGGTRNLVVVYLNGGNDALSTLVPYGDSDYYARRPTIAVPAGSVIQIGTDRGGTLLGLHPSLTGLKGLFDNGKLAVVQRTGYQNSSRSHFQGFDIWGTANPTDATGPGWLGRYLDTLPSPVDPLVGWNTSRETPRALMARTVGVPAITNPATYSFASPNVGAEAGFERAAAVADLVAPAGRPPAPGVCQLDGAGGARHARSRGHGGHLPAVAHLSQQRLRAGAAGGGRGDVPADRHQGVLGGDRRLRHARQPEPDQRRLSHADDDGGRPASPRLPPTSATRGCTTPRWCWCSRSSDGASPRTAARAPTTAPPG